MKYSWQNWYDVGHIWDILFRFNTDLLVTNAPTSVTFPDRFFGIRFVSIDYFLIFRRADVFNENGFWQRTDVHT